MYRASLRKDRVVFRKAGWKGERAILFCADGVFTLDEKQFDSELCRPDVLYAPVIALPQQKQYRVSFLFAALQVCTGWTGYDEVWATCYSKYDFCILSETRAIRSEFHWLPFYLCCNLFLILGGTQMRKVYEAHHGNMGLGRNRVLEMQREAGNSNTRVQWSIDEVIRQYFFQIEPLLIRRNGRWGGVARYVFEKHHDEREMLETAIASCRVKVLGSFVGLESFAGPDQISHIIFQMKTDPEAGYTFAGLDFISSWIRDKVVIAACQREISVITSFARSTAGVGPFCTLRGSTFEGLAHRMLCRGGEFSVRDLDSKRGAQLEIDIPRLAPKSFADWNQVRNASSNHYFQPFSRVLKAVDAVERPNKLFRMTVAANHPIHASVLVEAIKNLGCEGEVCLYFPLPADRFYKFKRQPFYRPTLRGPESESQLKARQALENDEDAVLKMVRQFALLIDCRRLLPSGRRKRRRMDSETSDAAVPAHEEKPSNVQAITAPAGAEAHKLGAAYSNELPRDSNEEIHNRRDLTQWIGVLWVAIRHPIYWVLCVAKHPINWDALSGKAPKKWGVLRGYLTELPIDSNDEIRNHTDL
jgi:hypothetical protein